MVGFRCVAPSCFHASFPTTLVRESELRYEKVVMNTALAQNVRGDEGSVKPDNKLFHQSSSARDGLAKVERRAGALPLMFVSRLDS